MFPNKNWLHINIFVYQYYLYITRFVINYLHQYRKEFRNVHLRRFNIIYSIYMIYITYIYLLKKVSWKSGPGFFLCFKTTKTHRPCICESLHENNQHRCDQVCRCSARLWGFCVTFYSGEVIITAPWLHASGSKQSFVKCSHMGLENGTNLENVELEDLKSVLCKWAI